VCQVLEGIEPKRIIAKIEGIARGGVKLELLQNE
jgi:hypothetical protein